MTYPNYVVGSASLRMFPPTTTVNWLAKHLPDPKDQREYAQERCVVAVTEALHNAMEQAGMAQAEIASALGKTPGYVSRVLNGTHNMTLHTLGDVLWACGKELRDVEFMNLGEIEIASEEWIQLSNGDWEEALSPPSEGAPSSPTRVLPFTRITGVIGSTNSIGFINGRD